MSQLVQILITTGNESAGTIGHLFGKPASNQRAEMMSLINYLQGCASGERTAAISVGLNGTAATGTIAFSGHNTAGDTIVVNGVTLTAVASGATNNQWNVTSASNTQAAAVAAAINASTTSLVSGEVTASVSGSTVTITSNNVGIYGNEATIAKGTDAGSVMTVSGARLTGGTSPTTTVYHFGL